MGERWSLDGYEVLHLVEGGSAGDLWCARDVERGELVALRRVGGDVDAAALRRSAERQADLPYAVRLRGVVEDGPVLVLVLDHGPGGTLERLLERRGGLEAGEVVTVGVPLALALAAGAERGLGHGDLTAASVWFGGGGRPLLAGLGLSDEPVEPADDVAALATLCLGLLRPHRDPSPEVVALLEVLERGRSPDPAAQPDAAAFASLLRQAHPPAPVRLQGVGEARHARPVEAAARAGRPSAGVVGAAALVLLVVAGAAVGWWSGRGGEQPAPPGAAVPSTAGAPASEWTVVLDRLDATRAAAFAAADPAALRRVYAPGAAGLVADSRRVAALAAADRTASGVRHVLGDVEVVSATADRARLRVVDALPSYEVRDADGAVVARSAARGQRVLLVELVRTAGGWRLGSVTPA